MLYSPLYSLPYVILMLAYVLLIAVEFLCKKTPGLALSLRLTCIGLFLFFFGFRGFIGWDWTNYYLVQRDVPELFNNKLADFLSASKLEPGFIIYVAFLKQIFNSYNFFVFTSTFIDVLLLDIFLRRYSQRYALGFTVFLLMGGFFMETDLMRNAKSIFLFLMSLQYLKERKALPYYLLNTLGLAFHVSAIIYFPVYFFLHRVTPKKIFFLFFIVGNIVFLLKIHYIQPIVLAIADSLGGKLSLLARAYFSNPDNIVGYGLSIGYIERLATALLILIYYKKLITTNSNNVLFINAFLIYFILFFYFAEASIVSSRLGYLYIFSYWILWPAILNSFTVWSNRLIFVCCISMYALLKFYSFANAIIYQYDNVLFGAKSYRARDAIFERISDKLTQ